jgi:hypothetical protein
MAWLLDWVLDCVADHPVVTLLAVFFGVSMLWCMLAPKQRRKRSFPIPCHRLQPKCRPDAGVGTAFRGRVDHKWARFKRRLAAGLFFFVAAIVLAAMWVLRLYSLGKAMNAVREMLTRLCNLQSHVDRRTHVDNTHYLLMKFSSSWTAVGFAGRCNIHCPKLVLGYQHCLARLWLGSWRASALDHELTHCVQDVLGDVMTFECHGPFPFQAAAGLLCEIHAHLFGGPLLSFSFLSVLAVVSPWFGPLFGVPGSTFQLGGVVGLGAFFVLACVIDACDDLTRPAD